MKLTGLYSVHRQIYIPCSGPSFNHQALSTSPWRPFSFVIGGVYILLLLSAMFISTIYVLDLVWQGGLLLIERAEGHYPGRASLLTEGHYPERASRNSKISKI